MQSEEDENQERGPQHVSVLTTEYIAKGLGDMEYSAFEAASDTRIAENESYDFFLANVIVQSLGRLKTPSRTFPTWHIPSMNQVIAILADDVPAQETLLDYWIDFNVPFKAMIYSGPFVIEGKMFSEDQDPPEFYKQAFRPIQDATITYQLGKQPEVIRVKLGLVNVFQVHGYSIEKL
ncbi:MAG: hypothetical protein K8S20_08355 [Chloroflexi bacterium]|nr:hypothetical protein [Chloroflexota bacterium]